MNKPTIVEISDAPATEIDYWEPILFSGDEIEAQIDRLASRPRPDDGRREAMFVHPRSKPPGLGMAPGIRVVLAVLLPGERTRPIRHNSTLIDLCARGAGFAAVGAQRIMFSQYDVWNTPAYRPYCYENNGDDIQVRLTFSNAPLLEKLNVHLVDSAPPGEIDAHAPADIELTDPRVLSPYETFESPPDGAMLMPYERLINPPVVASRALRWPWFEVKARLDELKQLGPEFVGRRLYLLYNPATGRTNGTTPNFFATMTIRPAGIVDRPHRHVSTAINYFFHGSGYSRIGGKLYRWKQGDLMLTAPGWMIHHHATDEEDFVYEFTVQDQPLHIALESLLWQEDLKRPAVVLGSSEGFATNRSDVIAHG